MKVKTLSMMAALGGSLVLGVSADAGQVSQVSGMFVGVGEVVDIGGTLYNSWLVYATGFDQVTSVFGDMNSPLSISSSQGGFYQDGLGSDTEPSQAFVNLFPSLGYDSYVTIGAEYQQAGDPLTQLSPNFPSGSPGGAPWGTGPLETMNGAWFRTPDSPFTFAQVCPICGAETVLIGRFTVEDGARLDGTVNLAWVNGGQSGTSSGLTFNFVVPSPGALALLGIAGLTGTRRRRRA